jgi:hypothetical protein
MMFTTRRRFTINFLTTVLLVVLLDFVATRLKE